MLDRIGICEVDEQISWLYELEQVAARLLDEIWPAVSLLADELVREKEASGRKVTDIAASLSVNPPRDPSCLVAYLDERVATRNAS